MHEASAVIDELGLGRSNAEAMEAGVPHPTPFLIDRQGIVRFVDAREDFHIWLDPELLRTALASLP
jgi:peroxiredoxin